MINKKSIPCALKTYKCAKCLLEKACVIKKDDALICIKCLYDFMGKDAFYEPLYSGFD